jgi:hypothetical protein
MNMKAIHNREIGKVRLSVIPTTPLLGIYNLE